MFFGTFHSIMQNFAGSMLVGFFLLSVAFLVSWFRQYEENHWIYWVLSGLAVAWLVTPSIWQLLFPVEMSIRAVMEARQLPSPGAVLVARLIGLGTGACAVIAARMTITRF